MKRVVAVGYTGWVVIVDQEGTFFVIVGPGVRTNKEIIRGSLADNLEDPYEVCWAHYVITLICNHDNDAIISLTDSSIPLSQVV